MVAEKEWKWDQNIFLSSAVKSPLKFVSPVELRCVLLDVLTFPFYCVWIIKRDVSWLKRFVLQCIMSPLPFLPGKSDEHSTVLLSTDVCTCVSPVPHKICTLLFKPYLTGSAHFCINCTSWDLHTCVSPMPHKFRTPLHHLHFITSAHFCMTFTSMFSRLLHHLHLLRSAHFVSAVPHMICTLCITWTSKDLHNLYHLYFISLHTFVSPVPDKICPLLYHLYLIRSAHFCIICTS